jgi:precorrin-6Y C5,15-methyltransferase (decarboxylating)
MVINAVTLETEARLVDRHAEHGGVLRRIAISRAEPLGRLHGWRTAIPITQWVATKP